MAEQDLWKRIDEALGLRPADPELVEAFKAAGFGDLDAARGATMMSSGRYFGFADAATTLATAGDRQPSSVQMAQIAEAARAWEAKAAELYRTGTNAWGRPRLQEGAKDAFGRRLPPTVADFREVGLDEADAKSAAAGLTSGRFVSFEDACLATALFDNTKNVSLNESLMRAKAKEFARVEGR